MLSVEDNEVLTRVGPGTPMGELLRRYWMPAVLVSEVPEPDAPPVRVRLLGEDLVAFRDTSGRVGLIQENCPHRGASLYFGRNEECGLRCPYHGWKFDASGACVDMPSEPATSTFKDRVKAKAYPTHESGGIVWTYMGPPETNKGFRDFGTESLPPERVFTTKMHSTCNWIQTMEGNVDSSHISWLHMYFGTDEIDDDGSDKPGYHNRPMSWKFWMHDRAPQLEVEDTWYGFKYVAMRTTPNGYTNARVSTFCMPFLVCVAAVPFATQQLMVVPIDDHNCWRWNFATRNVDNSDGVGGQGDLFAVSPYQRSFQQAVKGIIPREYTADNDYGIDRENQRTETFSGIMEFVSQDLMVTETMGPIYDRSQEHLGTIDKAIIRMRRLLIKSAQDLQDKGVEPPATDPSLDYRAIRSADKILDNGEDWRVLGTDEDPMVQRLELAQRDPQ